MNKNTIYGLFVGAVIVLSAGSYLITSQNSTDPVANTGSVGPTSFTTQSVSYPCSNIAQTGIPVQECQALVALYYSTDGDNWYNNTNWLDTSKPVSTWYGITVENGHVTKIFFEQNQLSGPIPHEIGNLTYLTTLNLSRNYYQSSLIGTIPAEIGKLKKLQYLDLSYNKLSGPLPAEIGQLTNLTHLDLRVNQFSGPIPAEIGQLSKLQLLDLFGNLPKGFSGPIPAELGKLSNLKYLSLRSNQLSGPIPVELGQLSSLNYLRLAGNQLSGPIPAELSQLNSLESLLLQWNQLSGPIPAGLFQLSKLQTLQLQENNLCGKIPNTFMLNGGWYGDDANGDRALSIYTNNLIDDENSYSPEMRDFLGKGGFINSSTNRIRDQTPKACSTKGSGIDAVGNDTVNTNPSDTGDGDDTGGGIRDGNSR